MLLAPPGANPLTGGYRYNREVAERLEARAGLRYRWVAVADVGVVAATAVAASRAVTPIVLDSLYQSTGPVVPALPDGALRVLLVHSVPWILWPQRSSVPPAAPAAPAAPAVAEAPRAPSGPAPEQAPGAANTPQPAYLRDCFGAIVTGAAAGEQLCAAGLPPGRVFVCRPGVDVAGAGRDDRRSRRPPAAGRAASPPPVGVLTVAHLTPGKGHLFLLERLAELRAVPWRWQVVGATEDAALAAELAARARQLGVAERVQLTGALSGAALGRAYGDADVFALATHGESYGMALAEAQAAALPVLTNAVGGTDETVHDGETGLLLPHGDTAAWRTALRRLLTDAQLRAMLRAGAERWRHSLPSWDAAAATFLDALDALRADAAVARVTPAVGWPTPAPTPTLGATAPATTTATATTTGAAPNRTPAPVPGMRSRARGAATAGWQRWHSLAALLLGAACWLLGAGLAPALAGYGLLAFGALYLVARPAARPADAATLLRLLLTVAVLLWSWHTDQWPWLKLALLVAAESTDFLDGVLARRGGATAFGAVLDMEVDAFVTLLLAANAAWFHDVGPWVLIAGLLRYAYALGEPALLRTRPPRLAATASPAPAAAHLPLDTRLPRWFSGFAKSICAGAVLLLIAPAVPGISWLLANLAAATAVVALTASFGLTVLLLLVPSARSAHRS